MIGRIQLIHEDGSTADIGGAVAIGRTIVVTAGHVVSKHGVTRLAFRSSHLGSNFLIKAIELDAELDIAVLTLSQSVSHIMSVGRAADGDSWTVPAPPSQTEPHLSGTVTAARRAFQNNEGRTTVAMQLHVAEQIKDYTLYSGSAVVAVGQVRRVVAILVEQQFERRWRPESTLRPDAANVLYAIPIDIAAKRAGVDVPFDPTVGDESPDGYDVRVSTVELVNHTAGRVDLPALPPAEAVAAAIDGSEPTWTFMAHRGWSPRFLLAPAISSGMWRTVFEGYRTTSDWRGFGGLHLGKMTIRALDSAFTKKGPSWSFWVIAAAEYAPYRDFSMPALRQFSPKLQKALAEIVTMPGLSQRPTEQSDIALNISPTVGAYLSLQWTRLHFAEGGADPNSLSGTNGVLLRVPARRGWSMPHYALGTFDIGQRKDEGYNFDREYMEQSRVVTFEMTSLNRKVGLRPAVNFAMAIS